MSLDQSQKFYESTYVPQNIQLFVAGNFNKKEVMDFINKKWGSYESSQAPVRILPEREIPTFLDRPFYSTKKSSHPSMSLGIKVENIDLKELFVLRSYGEFVAEEMMKKVRNKTGGTYGVQQRERLYERHGLISVSMDSTSEQFKNNLGLLRKLFFEKPQKIGLNEAEFEKAKTYLKNRFKNSYEEDARNLMWNALRIKDYKNNYGFTGSPLQLIDSITLVDYNAILKGKIKPKRYVIYKKSKVSSILLRVFCLSM